MDPSPGAPSIALCVPTFRRPLALRTLLESAVAQAKPFDEIIVSDDASGDDTLDVARSFAERSARLIVESRERNIGVIANFDAAIAAASADFVWLFGDDDRLRAGAVEQVLQTLALHPSAVGATVGVVHFDSALANPTALPPARRPEVCHGAAHLFERHADLLGYMSTLIIRRSAWLEAQARAEATSNLYEHVSRIAAAVGANGEWLILDSLVVDYRGDNDQFLGVVGGRAERMLLDAEAYDEVFRLCFPHRAGTRRRANARILKTHIISRLMDDRLRGPGRLRELSVRLARVYGRLFAFWLLALPLLLTPGSLLRWARSCYRAFSPTTGRARLKRLSPAL